MGCPFAQYRDIFGVAGQGPHALRVFGLPVVDWIGTIGIAALATWLFKIPFELTLTVALILGIVCHWLFGVPTSTLKYLGVTC